MYICEIQTQPPLRTADRFCPSQAAAAVAAAHVLCDMGQSLILSEPRGWETFCKITISESRNTAIDLRKEIMLFIHISQFIFKLFDPEGTWDVPRKYPGPRGHVARAGFGAGCGHQGALGQKELWLSPQL